MGASLDLSRQVGLLPADAFNNLTVGVVGVGAIGSHVVECMAKMGVRKFKIWDDDTVETHNLPNQGYGLGDLGKKKVHALKERIEPFTGAEIEATDGRANSDTVFGTRILVASADTMSARKAIFEAAIEDEDVEVFIDTRMGALVGFVFPVNMADPESVEAYEKTLFSDEEAEPVPCTEKATIFCAWNISSIVANLVFNGLRGCGLPATPNHVVIDLANGKMAITT